MNLPWFRMYSVFCGDPVIQSMTFEHQRHYVMLLCLKCDGLIDRKIKETVRNRLIARALAISEEELNETFKVFSELGLVEEGWQPRGWEKRQYVSDHSTHRVRKHRKGLNLQETGNVTEAGGNSFSNGPDQNRTEQKKVKGKQPQKRNGAFIPPTTEQVTEYAAEIQFGVDAGRFIDYYSTRGWMVGKNKMKCWKSALRTWKRNDNKNSSQPYQPYQDSFS